MFRRSQTIKESLSKTRQGFFGQITSLLGANEVTDELWEELEELLILADVGVNTTLELVERLQERAAREHIRRADGVQAMLKEELQAFLDNTSRPLATEKERMLTLILIVGANGSGKTTTIAKLTSYFQGQGRKVLLAAADTFRAAAINQLKIWGQRVNAEVIAHKPGADPGAVVYDAIRASQSRGADMLIVDTAGRLHTKYNLMQELKKVRGVAAKQVHQAPHETWLVLDATTGQNALSQARHFKEAVNVSGIILTKLDGTAKGGIVFAIARELELPIFFIGTGESVQDLTEFDAQAFVEGLFE
ncbi:MAG: signal recognition particle-docking protein FtsY [Anaerolineaceae bacterium 4572_32.1]|nr:MAG: signal recognition particle-docking protein FtsY [Anaerolineaceae bacterium 4572_32.1]